MVHSLAEGPFNLETILANNRARLAFLQEHSALGRFVNLAIIRKSVLAPPDALQAHRDGLREAYENTHHAPAAVAWLANGVVEGFDLLGPTFIANFAAVGIPMRLFREQTRAEQWLMEQLQK